MKFVKHIREFPAKRPAGKRALVMCGFGGSIWQLKRLITTLTRDGYEVTALDFSEEVLSAGDPTFLPELVDEVVTFADDRAKHSKKPILLVGVSLGALISLNILRRSKYFDRSVMITGGDIVKVAQRLYGEKVWPRSYDELAKVWQHINMYSDPKELIGKRLLFVPPVNDRLIDVADVRNEVARQNTAGNSIKLIERRPFGHVGTIAQEAVVFPKRTLEYIKQL